MLSLIVRNVLYYKPFLYLVDVLRINECILVYSPLLGQIKMTKYIEGEKQKEQQKNDFNHIIRSFSYLSNERRRRMRCVLCIIIIILYASYGLHHHRRQLCRRLVSTFSQMYNNNETGFLCARHRGGGRMSDKNVCHTKMPTIEKVCVRTSNNNNNTKAEEEKYGKI